MTKPVFIHFNLLTMHGYLVIVIRFDICSALILTSPKKGKEKGKNQVKEKSLNKLVVFDFASFFFLSAKYPLSSCRRSFAN